MVEVIFKFLQAATPTPAPVLDPTKIKEIIAGVLGVISAALAVANPVLSGILVAFLGLLVGGVYLFLKKAADKAATDAAHKDTDSGYQDQIDHRIPETKDSNERDNAGRDKLDKLP